MACQIIVTRMFNRKHAKDSRLILITCVNKLHGKVDTVIGVDISVVHLLDLLIHVY